MKKWWFLSLCILGIGFIGAIVYFKGESEKPLRKHLKETHGPYFFQVPITQFSSANIPCLNVHIGDRDILTELDLAFGGEAVFHREVVDSIAGKCLIDEKTMYGARGKSYKKRRFRAPEVKIGKLHFSDCIIHEESDEYAADAYILKNNTQNKVDDAGRIGWQMFKNTNLFLDLGNSLIAFCDSPETLLKHGYPIEEFVKTPLLIDRGFVEIAVDGPSGPQIWIFDTGSTWNILNIDENVRTLEEMALNSNNVLEISMKVEEHSFGPMPFHKLPIRLPIQIDAMLGVEFFKTHQVFIDFAENQVYIREVP